MASRRVMGLLGRRLVGLGVSLSSVASFSAVSGPGCLERVVTVPGRGGSGGSASNTGSGASGPSGPATALAMMVTELPANAPPCGLNACKLPPDTLFIELAWPSNTCQDPLGPTGANKFWQLQIGLPASDQVPGIHSLKDMAIFYEGTFQSIDGNSAAGQTSGSLGGGQGTIEVESIDKEQVTVRLTGVSLNLPMDGEYTAKRCTPGSSPERAPAQPHPSAARALLGAAPTSAPSASEPHEREPTDE